MAKEFAKAFYNSVAWQECREAYIISVFGLCERCRERGVAKPGHIVHHTIRLTPDNILDPNVTLNHALLRYDCLECHNAEEAAGLTRDDVMFDQLGQLIKRP